MEAHIQDLNARGSKFLSAAALLMPEDSDRVGSVIEADTRWTVPSPPAPGIDILVWGRPALPPNTPVAVAVKAAVKRELAILRLRRVLDAPYAVRAIHRLSPPQWQWSPVRNGWRTLLLSGAFVEVAGGRTTRRILDAIADAVDSDGSIRRFRIGTGGAILARVRQRDGSWALLRAALISSVPDPAAAGEGLAHLPPACAAWAPRLLGRGTTRGCSWTLESVLPGRRPRRVTWDTLRQVSRLCLQLPSADGPSSALVEDLERLAAALPDRAARIQRFAARAERIVEGLPSVMRHGDLWSGNLLAQGAKVCGVVDWGSWHPRSVPGTDLLHLFAVERALATRRHIGQVWREKPWASAPFLQATREYWSALGLAPEPTILEAVGVAWWASVIAGNLARLPYVRRDEGWLKRNVDVVLG